MDMWSHLIDQTKFFRQEHVGGMSMQVWTPNLGVGSGHTQLFASAHLRSATAGPSQVLTRQCMRKFTTGQ
jgi:hypothetical protein